jgi:pullulanase
MDHNSYNSPLSINAIDWSLKEKKLDFYKYFKDLIKLRKSYSEFTMEKAEDIKAKIKFIYMREQNNFIGYTISLKEDNKYLLILHNGNSCNFNLSMAAMKSHLSENYSIVAGEMNLKEILDQKGLIENNKIIKNPEKLEVENYSTSIYEITNIKN